MKKMKACMSDTVRTAMAAEFDGCEELPESTEGVLYNEDLEDGLARNEARVERKPSAVKDLVDSLERSDSFRQISTTQATPGSTAYGTVAFSTAGYAQEVTAISPECEHVEPAYVDKFRTNNGGEEEFFDQLQEAIQRRQDREGELTAVHCAEQVAGASDANEDGSSENLVSPYHTYYAQDGASKPDMPEESPYALYDDTHHLEPVAEAGMSAGAAVPLRNGLETGDDAEEPIYQDPATLGGKESFDPVVEYHDSDSDQEYTWGSTEFESFSDDPEPEPCPDKEERRRSSSTTTQTYGVFGRIRQTIRQVHEEPESDDDEMYIDFDVSMKKHPAPTLPPAPDGLSPEQVKRRHIVGCIIESENSYVQSLQRLMKEYQVPLLDANPPIISRVKVRTIFYKVKQILQCHTMFQIALSGRVAAWDAEEKIGDCFTASFAKSMVLDVYSDFVNNFSVAMDLAKYCAKRKPVFAEFLKCNQTNSADKLSLFGLMVKPVQRFPQFILLLQDLLKHTSKDHHDRLALQLALTELENLAHKLNDRKRDSEQRHAAKQVFSNLNVKLVHKSCDGDPHLIREDDVIESVYNSNGTLVKSKPRRLIMLNDTLLCAGVHHRDTDLGRFEKYHLKMSIPIKSVLVKDTVITPDAKVGMKGQLGRITICSARPYRTEQGSEDLYRELDNLLHDFTVISQMTSMVSSLKCSYEKLNEELLQNMSKEIQVQIQRLDDHLRTMDSSALQLVFRSKSGHKERLYIQMGSPELKQSWLADLRTAQLATCATNNSGWMEKEDKGKRVNTQLPLFMNPLNVNITQQMDRVTCCVAFLLPSYREDGRARQFIWLCGGTDARSSVTIISLGTEEVHVTESFTACDGQILCTELVPGCEEAGDTILSKESVWMGTSTGRLFVHGLQDNHRQKMLLSFSVRNSVLCLIYSNEKLFAGLQSGEVVVYQRSKGGVWQIGEPTFITLASHPITCILAVDSNVWCACGNSIHILDSTTLKVEKVFKMSLKGDNVQIKFMVRAGVGLFISYFKMAVIQLYHMETFDHLQDINVSSTVSRSQSEMEFVNKSGPTEEMKAEEKVEITAMVGSRSWLWIGTSTGRILSIPLPRLEGVPLTTGRPLVSYHGHTGPVSFLVPTVKPLNPSKLVMSKRKTDAEEDVFDEEKSDYAKMSGRSKKLNFKLPDLRTSKRKSAMNARRVAGHLWPRRRSSSKECDLGVPKARSLGNLSNLDDSSTDCSDDINTLYSALMCDRDSDFDDEIYSSLAISDSILDHREEPLYMEYSPRGDFMRSARKTLSQTKRRLSSSQEGQGRSSFTLPATLKSDGSRQRLQRPKSEAFNFPEELENTDDPAYTNFSSAVVKSLDEEDLEKEGRKNAEKNHLGANNKKMKQKLNFVGNSYIVVSGGKNYKCYKQSTGSEETKGVNPSEPVLLMWQCSL